MALRPPHAFDVRPLAQVGLPDVVPGAHLHAVVDRHGHDRRVRKQEADRRAIRQAEQRHDFGPAAAIVAEPVHPDDRSVRIGRGLDFDCGEKLGGHRTAQCRPTRRILADAHRGHRQPRLRNHLSGFSPARCSLPSRPSSTARRRPS